MVVPSVPENELERLADLLSYDILDTPAEEELNEIVQLASDVCNTPISLISLIDDKRQWFKARKGLDAQETSKEFAFCAHAIHGNDLFMVPNALEDERFWDNPLVEGRPDIRFYAGVPLTSAQGHNLGTLCVIGTEPATLTEEQIRALQILAKQVVTHFELRKNNRHLTEALKTVDKQKEELSSHNKTLTRLLSIIGHDLKGPVENLKQLFSLFVSAKLSKEEIDSLAADLNGRLESTSDLLGNLLSWATSQLNDASLQSDKFDLHDIAEEQLHRIKGSAVAKGNSLLNKVKKGSVITADRDIIRFVIRNLITNANKFTSEGAISVALEESEDLSRIVVADTGQGMSQEAIKALFNWNDRRTTAGTLGEKGSGLGLLIVRQFASQYNGRLIIESEVGKGTKVVFEMAKDIDMEPSTD
ncbi:GAF domain-containing sensor histidine kinase [Imperialibacter roseus]|uniref:histidine kinase n=1 Tax=Imperialibacter roseus TaxID=1324217 RepID=A0ABZ0IKT6_9BACT|nr:GAF domain-containing sensor histidine kinase [Imperialibacter roseus]WOK05638.1 GAF domain-containing sensor histidine kinase [Imperialibacter roseus]